MSAWSTRGYLTVPPMFKAFGGRDFAVAGHVVVLNDSIHGTGPCLRLARYALHSKGGGEN